MNIATNPARRFLPVTGLGLNTSRRAFFGSLVAPLCYAADAKPRLGLRFVAEFGSRLGLFDISDDGALLAVHQNAGQIPCGRDPSCREVVHRIRVQRSIDRRTVNSLEMTFEGDFRWWVIAFVPGSQNLLLRGKRMGSGDQPGFHEWNPMNGDWRRLPEPPKGFEFVSFVDHSRILATVPENRKRKNVLWDTRTGAISDAQSECFVDPS